MEYIEPRVVAMQSAGSSTMRRALVADLLAPALLLGAAACSDKTASVDGGDYGPCVRFTSDASLSAPVSFAVDVAPVFQSNCTSGGVNCHATYANRPYLGQVDAGDDAATILASIVGVVAAEDPSMNLVTPDDPVHSFLMHKLDGDQCTLAQQCADSGISSLTNGPTPCGNDMPNGAPTLPAAVRDAVRAWITQGAANN
jgi:hypothetical protein